jgi:hypothetical protein
MAKHNSGVSMNRVYKIGEVIGLGGNTGYSTGPHTHLRLRRLKLVGARYMQIDTNEAQNSIDPIPYFTGQYAADIAPPFKHFFSRDLAFGEISDEIAGTLQIPVDTFSATPGGVRMAIES